jgi:hypothetical protein
MYAHHHHHYNQGGNGSGSRAVSAAVAAQNYPVSMPTTAATSTSTTTSAAPSDQNRRIKRLERNRESARLSRKRRKAYLEELEAKVHSLSAQMDRERVAYALNFLNDVKTRFSSSSTSTVATTGMTVGNGIQISQNSGIKHNIHSSLPLSSASNNNSYSYNNNYTMRNNNNLTEETKTRIPTALQTIYAFQHAYLSSLVISKESKFILWLMLQREGFWRGGRGNSERLSAARIGERVSLLPYIERLCVLWLIWTK